MSDQLSPTVKQAISAVEKRLMREIERQLADGEKMLKEAKLREKRNAVYRSCAALSQFVAGFIAAITVLVPHRYGWPWPTYLLMAAAFGVFQYSAWRCHEEIMA